MGLQYKTELLKKLKLARELAQPNRPKNLDLYRNKYNLNQKIASFNIGDQVIWHIHEVFVNIFTDSFSL
jgi:hypothetical protein